MLFWVKISHFAQFQDERKCVRSKNRPSSNGVIENGDRRRHCQSFFPFQTKL